MSNDISYEYTKEANKKEGRHGWVGWQSEKENNIPINKYGMHVVTQHKRGKQAKKK